MARDYWSKYKFAKDLRPDLMKFTGSGYPLDWVGRIKVKNSGEVHWDDVFVGKIVKYYKLWIAVPSVEVDQPCLACKLPTTILLDSGKGFRCNSPDNVYEERRWKHPVRWIVKKYKSKNEAIDSLLPKM